MGGWQIRTLLRPAARHATSLAFMLLAACTEHRENYRPPVSAKGADEPAPAPGQFQACGPRSVSLLSARSLEGSDGLAARSGVNAFSMGIMKCAAWVRERYEIEDLSDRLLLEIAVGSDGMGDRVIVLQGSHDLQDCLSDEIRKHHFRQVVTARTVIAEYRLASAPQPVNEERLRKALLENAHSAPSREPQAVDAGEPCSDSGLVRLLNCPAK